MMAGAPRGLIIAAPGSGSGKTTVTLGLLRALSRRGVVVQPFKCGPDYIDPAFHAVAAGRPSFNLDTWAMRPNLIAGLIAGLSTQNGDDALCIAEGVMGLFDGAGVSGHFGTGSTADLAAMTGWPVVLVLDVRAQAETAAAIVHGCKTYRSDIDLAGVILNNVAGAYHEHVVADAIRAGGVPVLGAIAHVPDLTLPERHLGLLQASETADIAKRIDGIADAVAASVRLEAVVDAAGPLQLAKLPRVPGADDAGPLPMKPPGQRIALAHDDAFSFVYPHVLMGWRRAGAQIVRFSPLAYEAPPPDCDAIWLPGGYPELHAETLANAATFKSGMRAAAARDIPIHGECGGYMVLGRSLEAADGHRYEMLGLLSLETSFARRQLYLGYRRARVLDPLGTSGLAGEILGHEFHFATILANHDTPLADICDARGEPVADGGARRGPVSGTFFHVIDSKP